MMVHVHPTVKQHQALHNHEDYNSSCSCHTTKSSMVFNSTFSTISSMSSKIYLCFSRFLRHYHHFFHFNQSCSEIRFGLQFIHYSCKREIDKHFSFSGTVDANLHINDSMKTFSVFSQLFDSFFVTCIFINDKIFLYEKNNISFSRLLSIFNQQRFQEQ